MNTFISILLIVIPLTLGVLTIHVNERLRELKSRPTPDKMKVLTFDLTENNKS